MNIRKGIKNKLIKTFGVSVMIVLSITGTSRIYEHKLLSSKAEANRIISSLKKENDQLSKDCSTYKYLYGEQEKDIIQCKEKANSANAELETLKNEIALSKENEQKLSRGDYQEKDLANYAIMTVDEMNNWIAERAPKNSPFIDKGLIFIKASQESGLDPKYLVAHAALESSWGTSEICQMKNNYYGIGAFNSSPYESAYNFDSGLESGIIEGAKWIKQNYYSKGQTSLTSMIYGNPNNVYCTTDDGRPSSAWIRKISDIIY